MVNSDRLFICSDLDRTIIPNGPQQESGEARPILRGIVSQLKPLLSYVSGRDLKRILNAISEFDLPMPDFIVADVGTTIYHFREQQWQPLEQWQERLADDWGGQSADAIKPTIANPEPLSAQPDDQQGPFKLSYEVSPSHKMMDPLREIERRLDAVSTDGTTQGRDIRYQIISSVDETCDQGLVDIIPASAGKLGALRFLSEYLQLDRERVYFCGDSGNDRDVLLSEFNACLVGNATDEFRQQLREAVAEHGSSKTLYFANGRAHPALDGNYSAGLVEGLVHFYPDVAVHIPKDQHERF